MMTILLALLISLVVAFIATQNSTPVSLAIGDSVLTNLPLFFVVLVAILLGMAVASIVTIINLVKAKLAMSGKNSELKKTYNTVGELRGRVAELERENATLRDQIDQLAPKKK